MTIVLCDRGKERLAQFMESENPLVVATRTFCEKNRIGIISEDDYFMLALKPIYR